MSYFPMLFIHNYDTAKNNLSHSQLGISEKDHFYYSLGGAINKTNYLQDGLEFSGDARRHQCADNTLRARLPVLKSAKHKSTI